MTTPTEPAQAVLFMRQTNGRTSTDLFTEDNGKSPYHVAESLREACRDDFPGAIWAIGQNEASKVLMGRENMRRMGIWTDDEIKEALA